LRIRHQNSIEATEDAHWQDDIGVFAPPEQVPENVVGDAPDEGADLVVGGFIHRCVAGSVAEAIADALNPNTTSTFVDGHQSRRTRLRADVVTGKLDVRAAAAQLPDPESAPAEADQPAEEES